MRDPIVTCREGTLSGYRVEGLDYFRGIPYAAAPVDQLRFEPPQNPRSWDSVRRCVDPGPVAPQPDGPLRDSNREMAEDCLNLDIVTPAGGDLRPVVVWIHGGGYFAGSSLAPESEGSKLAAEHDVLVVSVTHRLGILGYLDLESYGVEGSGTAGLMDLLAALRWIQTNIAAFGGDPQRVTIAGHSGGGGKVSMLLASPELRDACSGAVIMAGPEFDLNTVHRAGSTTRELLGLIGVNPQSGDVLARLRAIDVDDLLQLQAALGVGVVPGPQSMRFSPVIGRSFLPVPPSQAYARGVSSQIPLILGTSRDEARLATRADPGLLHRPLSEEGLARFVADGLDAPSDTDELVTRYKSLYLGFSARELSLTIASDQFRIRTLRMAEARLSGGGRQTYVYRYDLPEGDGCAPHGAEVAGFFGWGRTAELTQNMVAFARTGAPSEEWPPYTLEQRSEFRIKEESTAVCNPDALARQAWDGIATGHFSNPWARLLEPGM